MNTYVCNIVENNTIAYWYSCYTVPSPTVDVGFATPGAVTYAGNNVTLNCGIVLLGGVTDSDVTVSSRWTKDAAPFSSVSGRVTLTPSQRLTGSNYFTQLMFSPLSSSMDNGTYVCVATLTPRQPQFVTGTNTSDSMAVAVRGEITQLITIICYYRYNLLPRQHIRTLLISLYYSDVA